MWYVMPPAPRRRHASAEDAATEKMTNDPVQYHMFFPRA